MIIAEIHARVELGESVDSSLAGTALGTETPGGSAASFTSDQPRREGDGDWRFDYRRYLLRRTRFGCSLSHESRLVE